MVWKACKHGTDQFQRALWYGQSGLVTLEQQHRNLNVATVRRHPLALSKAQRSLVISLPGGQVGQRPM